MHHIHRREEESENDETDIVEFIRWSVVLEKDVDDKNVSLLSRLMQRRVAELQYKQTQLLRFTSCNAHLKRIGKCKNATH